MTLEKYYPKEHEAAETWIKTTRILNMSVLEAYKYIQEKTAEKEPLAAKSRELLELINKDSSSEEKENELIRIQQELSEKKEKLQPINAAFIEAFELFLGSGETRFRPEDLRVKIENMLEQQQELQR